MTKANDLHSTLRKATEDISDDVIDWRHHLHSHPELSNREVETEKFITEKLREFGINEITDGIAGHGVLAVIRGGAKSDDSRSILLRADIDALPVKETADVDFASTVVDEEYPGGPFPVSHACGHDCHTAMLLGAAKILDSVADELPGDVYLCFQPAEEGPPVDEDGGARMMIEDSAFTKLDPKPTMAFGMHVVPAPKGKIGYSRNVQHASSELVKITVEGEQVHGSQPWAGIDPMPPAADIITAMGQLYRQVDAQNIFTITIGHIEDEGRFNIVGQKVTLWGTVRCMQKGVMPQINERIVRTVENIASAYGCEGSTEFFQEIPPVVNSPEWIDAVLPSFRSVVGEDNADTDVLEVPGSLGYDDVSEFINEYGGVYALLGVQDVELSEEGLPEATSGGRGLVPNHNPKFYADDDTLSVGVLMHATVAVDHLYGQAVPQEHSD